MATRKAARETLTAILTAEMTTCEEVNGYFKSDPAGQSPVLCLHSLGTMAVPFTAKGSRPTYNFDVIVYVRRGGTGITEAEAEDTLDDVAHQLYEAVEANRKNIAWQSLTYLDRSEAVPVDVGGVPYWMEITSLAMEVFSSG